MDRYGTLRSGLVGAWCPSLRAGGYTLEDRSNRRNNGTLTNGATWEAGALSLTRASSQYVAVGASTTYTPLLSGPMSATAWIRPSVVNVTQDVVAGYGGGALGLFLLEIGRTSGRVNLLQNGNAVTATSAASIAANQWSFVGFTRAGTTSAWTIQLLINNVIESFTTSENPTTSNVAVAIGRAGGLNNLYFGGLLDDVRLWNRPLTQSEVSILRTRPGIGLAPSRHRRANVLGSQFWLRDAGTWKTATPWLKVNGVWTKATPKLNVGGTWK